MASSRKSKSKKPAAKPAAGSSKSTFKARTPQRGRPTKKQPPAAAPAAADKPAPKRKTVRSKPDATGPSAAMPQPTREDPKSARKAKKKSVAAPRAPRLDPEFVVRIRDALVQQRQRLLSVMRSTRAQMADKAIGLADVSDQASEGYGDELAVGLMAIEAAQIEDIDAALVRIDEGTYGVCTDCGKLVPKKRLEVLPFALRCLPCEGAKEHRARTQASYSDEDDE